MLPASLQLWMNLHSCINRDNPSAQRRRMPVSFTGEAGQLEHLGHGDAVMLARKAAALAGGVSIARERAGRVRARPPPIPAVGRRCRRRLHLSSPIPRAVAAGVDAGGDELTSDNR